MTCSRPCSYHSNKTDVIERPPDLSLCRLLYRKKNPTAQKGQRWMRIGVLVLPDWCGGDYLINNMGDGLDK